MRGDTGGPDSSRMGPYGLTRSTAEKVRLRKNLVLFQMGSTKFFRPLPRVMPCALVWVSMARPMWRALLPRTHLGLEGPACDEMTRWATAGGVTSLTGSTAVVERLK